MTIQHPVDVSPGRTEYVQELSCDLQDRYPMQVGRLIHEIRDAVAMEQNGTSLTTYQDLRGRVDLILQSKDGSLALKMDELEKVWLQAESVMKNKESQPDDAKISYCCRDLIVVSAVVYAMILGFSYYNPLQFFERRQ